MKKTLLAVASAVLAFALISCANGSGGGKRAVTNNNGAGGANATGGETVIPISSVSKTFLASGSSTIIDDANKTITFKGGVDTGILFGENVEAIEFRLPAGENLPVLPLGLTYLNSEPREGGDTDMAGFLINRKGSVNYSNLTYDGWDFIIKAQSGTAESIRSGGYGGNYCNNQTGQTKYHFTTPGGMVTLNEAIFGQNDGYKVKVELDKNEDKIIVTNVESGATWTSQVVPTEIRDAKPTLQKRLALSRGFWRQYRGTAPTNAPDVDLTLTDVKVYLRNSSK